MKVSIWSSLFHCQPPPSSFLVETKIWNCKLSASACCSGKIKKGDPWGRRNFQVRYREPIMWSDYQSMLLQVSCKFLVANALIYYLSQSVLKQCHMTGAWKMIETFTPLKFGTGAKRAVQQVWTARQSKGRDLFFPFSFSLLVFIPSFLYIWLLLLCLYKACSGLGTNMGFKFFINLTRHLFTIGDKH